MTWLRARRLALLSGLAAASLSASVLPVSSWAQAQPPVLETIRVRAIFTPVSYAGAARNAIAPNAISKCVKSTNEYYTTAWARTFDTTKSPRYTINDAKKARRTFGMDCAARYPVQTAPDSMLVHLAALYSLIDEDSLAHTAVRRSLSAATLPAMVLAERLVVGAQTFSKDTNGVQQAKEYVTQLAELGPGYLEYRVKAMLSLLSLYQRVQWFDESATYGDTLLALEPRDPTMRKATHGLFAQALLTLAFTYADAGRGPSAVWCANRILAEYEDTPQAETAAALLPRFLLLGRPAPMITGHYWLNPSITTPRTVGPTPGKVSVLLFATYWCDACDSICRSFEKLHQEFTPSGKVEFRFVTRTNTVVLPRKKPPTIAQQIAVIKAEFVGRFGMTMPIAIEAVDTALALSTGDTDNEHRYKVNGYPTYALIDTEGRVRYLITGWGGDSERRLRARIQEMVEAGEKKTQAAAAAQ